MNRAMFLKLMGSEWLPSIPDLHARLKSDPPAHVADIGCGLGWSSIGIARAYPKVYVDGYDLDLIRGAIRPRRAKGGEALTLLDEKAVELVERAAADNTDLVNGSLVVRPAVDNTLRVFNGASDDQVTGLVVEAGVTLTFDGTTGLIAITGLTFHSFQLFTPDPGKFMLRMRSWKRGSSRSGDVAGCGTSSRATRPRILLRSSWKGRTVSSQAI